MKKKKPKKEEPVIEDEVETNSKGEILNKIIVHESGGLKAGRVYLAFEDGRLVPKTNRVQLGTPVYLVVAIEDGWTVEDGMVSLDATLRIVASTGELVLNAPNLFKNSPLVKEADAAYINLKAGIAKTRADIEYYIVSYRLWDKKGKGEIKGSYKLFIENTSE